jgi:hypothetical protein
LAGTVSGGPSRQQRDYLYRTAAAMSGLRRSHMLAGHGRRLRRAHDERRENIWLRRGICHPCGKTFTSLPDWLAACVAGNWPVRASPRVIPLSKQRRTEKIRRARPIRPHRANGHIGVCSLSVSTTICAAFRSRHESVREIQKIPQKRAPPPASHAQTNFILLILSVTYRQSAMKRQNRLLV